MSTFEDMSVRFILSEFLFLASRFCFFLSFTCFHYLTAEMLEQHHQLNDSTPELIPCNLSTYCFGHFCVSAKWWEANTSLFIVTGAPSIRLCVCVSLYLILTQFVN